MRSRTDASIRNLCLFQKNSIIWVCLDLFASSLIILNSLQFPFKMSRQDWSKILDLLTMETPNEEISFVISFGDNGP